MHTWDKNELRNLAFASGKPLEVQCAEAFYQKGWHVRLGSFYRDIDNKLRELDVLVEKRLQLDFNEQRCDVTLRVLCSCKGFPTENRPVTYSVSQNRNVTLQPKFMFGDKSHFGPPIMPNKVEEAADLFIRRALLEQRQVICFDIFERAVTQKKNGKELIGYKRKTDRDLYEGLDSAIKAAIFGLSAMQKVTNETTSLMLRLPCPC